MNLRNDSSTKKRHFLATLLLLMAAMVLPGIKADAFGQKNVLKLADSVTPSPGAVAWSPDGKKIAFISGAVVILDPESRSEKRVSVSSPYFLCWTADNLLYVLHRAEDRKVLIRIDTDTLKKTEVPLPFQPEGIFALPGEKTLVMVTAAFNQKRLWSEMTYAVHLFDPGSATAKKIYESSRTLPRQTKRADHLSGWLWAGPRPGDSAFLTMESVKPPVVMPYLQLGMVDFITGRAKTFGRIESPALSVPVSWSPDGRRFAFSDTDGILHMYDIERSVISAPEKGLHIRGTVPAWNPRGSQIYFGGHIIWSDGGKTDVLGPEGQDNIGFWSPDGRKIAIASKNGFYLFDDHRPVLVPPDRVPVEEKTVKLRLLKELLAEGLISEQEYIERYTILMKYME